MHVKTRAGARARMCVRVREVQPEHLKGGGSKVRQYADGQMEPYEDAEEQKCKSSNDGTRY
jgi:hypothetical protein